MLKIRLCLQGCKYNYWDTGNAGIFLNHFKLLLVCLACFCNGRFCTENTGICCSTLCFCPALGSSCSAVSLWIRTLSVVINYHESRPVSRLWCGLAVDVFPRVSSTPLSLSSSQRQSSIVLSHRGWNHFISTCVSSPVFLLLLVLPFYVILCKIWECAVLCCLLENKLISDFWHLVRYHHAVYTLNICPYLFFVSVFFFWPIIKNRGLTVV